MTGRIAGRIPEQDIPWYSDSSLTASLPPLYRLYAAYSRLAGSRSSRRVRGGSFLLRSLRRINAIAHLPATAIVHATSDTKVSVDLNDDRLLEVLHEIRGQNPEYGVLREALSPGDTFIDVGANFGTFSLLASRLVGDSGRVIAIEPQVRLCQAMRESLSANSIRNCEILCVACGARSSEARLFVPSHDSGRAGMFAGFSATGSHSETKISVIALDDVAKEWNLAGKVFVKIDVEGSELDVLEGAERLIRERKPRLMLEINPWSAAAAGRSPGALLERLKRLGYSSFATPASYPSPVPAQSIRLDRQSNIVAMP